MSLITINFMLVTAAIILNSMKLKQAEARIKKTEDIVDKLKAGRHIE